jgi:hypothetical protein
MTTYPVFVFVFPWPHHVGPRVQTSELRVRVVERPVKLNLGHGAHQLLVMENIVRPQAAVLHDPIRTARAAAREPDAIEHRVALQHLLGRRGGTGRGGGGVPRDVTQGQALDHVEAVHRVAVVHVVQRARHHRGAAGDILVLMEGVMPHARVLRHRETAARGVRVRGGIQAGESHAIRRRRARRLHVHQRPPALVRGK